MDSLFDSINNLNAIPDDENLIIEYLLNRLERGITYTWVGPILLSLNPQENSFLDFHCFSKNKSFDSSQIFEKNIKPHIFAVAATAHFKLLNNLGRPSQVILISGDSGAGKTFNANQAINFLAAINKSSSTYSLDGRGEEKLVEEKIVNACPLINAFSTASTEKNSQSSRHGQLIRFEYEKGIISGASIHSFLIERTRVTKGSNNFMIFYQLLFGSSDPQLQRLGLSKEESYNLLGSNPYIKNEELDQCFQKTCEAMKAFGFSENERKDIFCIIALLIHLGNIKFVEIGDGSIAIDVENEASRKALEKSSLLSAVPENELKELLTTIVISTHSQWRKHSMYRRNLGSIEICRNRLFSIIRHIYDNLFHWLIDRINQTLSTGGEHHTWLGILDIFGFESFVINGLEELSINYANERLQLYFMQEYLVSGQEELLEEGLSDLPTPRIIDVYRDRLNAIEVNLFTILNDASHHSIENRLSYLRNQFLTPKNCNVFKESQRNETFIINHYSQPVEYSLQDLISKNSDKVPNELSTIFTGSSNKLLKFLSDRNENKFLNKENNIYARKGTTLAKVKHSLDVLLKDLKKCDTNYVKCVKPRFSENSWDKIELKKQLIYTGILDALPLARCKFPIRFSYDEFNDRYSKKHVNWKNVSCLLDSASNVQRSKDIVQEFLDKDTLPSIVFFGNRLIFLKESFFFTLENQRNEHRHQSAVRIQKFWKKYQHKNAANLNKDQFTDCETETKFVNNEKLLNISNFVNNQKSNDAEKMNENSKLNLIHFTTYFHVKPNQYGHSHIIYFERNMFFYKNRILSRQRLAEVPVRFHTRLTCLLNSHCLPRSELPNGLEDCL